MYIIYYVIIAGIFIPGSKLDDMESLTCQIESNNSKGNNHHKHIKCVTYLLTSMAAGHSIIDNLC
jgi:hypothetical protein